MEMDVHLKLVILHHVKGNMNVIMVYVIRRYICSFEVGDLSLGGGSLEIDDFLLSELDPLEVGDLLLGEDPFGDDDLSLDEDPLEVGDLLLGEGSFRQRDADIT
jgi:hypothetical protein